MLHILYRKLQLLSTVAPALAAADLRFPLTGKRNSAGESEIYNRNILSKFV